MQVESYDHVIVKDDNDDYYYSFSTVLSWVFINNYDDVSVVVEVKMMVMII